MKNTKLLKETISSLNKYLYNKKDRMFNLHYNLKTKKIDKLRTTFVEAHCAHCLYELGYKKQAKIMVESILNSQLFDQKSCLFRFSIKNNKIINPDKNGCSNLLMIRNLAELGFKKEAEEIMKKFSKAVFNKKKKLFGRSTRDKKLFVAQTNLWGVKAFEALDKQKEAKKLLNSIIETFYDKNSGLISSSSTQEGKYGYKFTFCDDNFLFCYVADKYYPKLCENIAKRMLKSILFDKETGLFNRSIRLNDNFLNVDKSVYKNAVCLLGLKAVKHPYAKKLEEVMISRLYNKKEKLFWDCFADSNLLACWAISK